MYDCHDLADVVFQVFGLSNVTSERAESARHHGLVRLNTLRLLGLLIISTTTSLTDTR